MKSLRNKLYLIYSLLTILVLSISCEGIEVDLSEVEGLTGTTQTGILTATIDGVDWSTTTAGANISGGILGIAGVDAAGKSIAITLTATTTGTYQLDEFSTFGAGAYTAASGEIAHTSNATSDVGGTITISEINLTENWMSGTFSFSAFRFTDNTTVNITKGVFTKIPITDGSNTGDADDNFSAKIDGTALNPTSITAVSESFIGTITITGMNGDKAVGVILPLDVTEGTYEFAIALHPTALYNIGTGINVTSLVPDAGSVSITKHDATSKRIEGTFSFEASEFGGTLSASITEGKFAVTYQ